MTVNSAVFAVVLGAVGFVVPALADEEPKRGGTLNYMIPADAPPSFDAHREGTFATLYSGAPFYSVLIRVDPNNPSSTTDFVCDLCTSIRSTFHLCSHAKDPQKFERYQKCVTPAKSLSHPAGHLRPPLTLTS